MTEINYFDKDLFIEGLLTVYVTTEAEAESLIQTLPSLVDYNIAFTTGFKSIMLPNLREGFNKSIYVMAKVGYPKFFYGSGIDMAEEFGCKYSFNWSLFNKTHSTVSLEGFLKDFW